MASLHLIMCVPGDFVKTLLDEDGHVGGGERGTSC